MRFAAVAGTVVRRVAASVVAAVVCGAVAPGLSAAATIAVRNDMGVAIYRAGPGEQNRVAVTQADEFTVRLADPGAVVTAGVGCRSIDTHTADCARSQTTMERLSRVRVVAGDMNDEVRSSGPALTANGGIGNDVLQVTGFGSGSLNGGGGRDTLLGGDNLDVFVDGDTPGAADADIVDGGPGDDRVSYATRSAPVRVDLGDAVGDGEVGEGDVLRSIEGVTGGSGADDLRGGPEANRLDGLAGADRIDGRGGPDGLEGGSGADTLIGSRGEDEIDMGSGADAAYGGAGDDMVFVSRGRPVRVACGRGTDEVFWPRRRDFLRRDCEWATFSRRTTVTVDAFPQRRDSSSVTFDVSCPRDHDLEEETTSMRGLLRLRSTGKHRPLLGRGEIPARDGRRCYFELMGRDPVPVRVNLNGRGQRLASRPRGVLAVVSLHGRNLPNARWTIRLKIRRSTR